MTVRAAAFLGVVGVAVTVVMLVFFAVDTLRNAPETFVAIVVVAALAVAFEFVWKRARGEPAAGVDATAPRPEAG